ncbi:MAG: hypothetical protein EOP53_21690 [Sphingobacteriales bacterium]|nr:MAG: hypothetical protein EOP53_21690 [Sphingobacteriales bacterium]
MNWFTSLFKNSSSDKSNRYKPTVDYVHIYNKANELHYQHKLRTEEVLKLYDSAIEGGIPEAYGDRAYCLQSMEFHFDSISDFSGAIQLDVYDANLYYGRAISRKAIDDLHGAIDDLKMAISLSKIPNAKNFQQNARAKEIGWKSATAMYEFDLETDLKDIQFNNEHPEIYNELKNRTVLKKRVDYK